MNKKNIAFIPVRGGSKSIPLKNIKLINNRPLVYWVLDAAVECNYIDEVVVFSDSEQIKKVVAEYSNNKIKVVERSEESASDTASTEFAMLEYANNNTFDTITLIQATSPLLKKEDLDKGFELYQQEGIDSVLSVVNQKRFIWESLDGKGKSKNYDFKKRPRRQEFSGYMVENGAFYITSRELLLETKNRLAGNIGLVEMSEETYFEIDEPLDWIIVEELLKRKENKKSLDLSHIKMLLTDCDGVLTDGGMYYSEAGDELKKFNTKDGMGFQLLREKGILTGIITGEDRELVRNRATKMKVNEVYMGVQNKYEVLTKICKKYNLQFNEVAYIGDDINDSEVIKAVGYGCSVADGMESIKEIADYITKCKGGEGAIREVAETILQYHK